MTMNECSLFLVPFRGRHFPVTYNVSSVSVDHAKRAMDSQPFRTWCQRCEHSVHERTGQYIDIHAVEIQSVEMVGNSQMIGCIHIHSDCTLKSAHGDTIRKLPGIFFLRGITVAILVGMFLDTRDENDNHDDNDDHETAYTLLVERPRLPLGQVTNLELPTGIMDEDDGAQYGATQRIRAICGVEINASEWVNLTKLALPSTDVANERLPLAAVPMSPGSDDELCRILYAEKRLTRVELEAIRKGPFHGEQNQDGEPVLFRVIPVDQIWSISGDAKSIVALFLLQQLRQQQRLALAGGLATPLTPEPRLAMNNGATIPQLAFGLYKVPANDEGEAIILNAIRAGYRHFDGAAYYQNEHILGRALRKSGLPRSAFFLTTKVWNDSLRAGPRAVRASVRKSLSDLDFGTYFDLCLIHWPVPGHFVEGYKALEDEHDQGTIRFLGLSNFNEEEYEELGSSGLRVSPVCNQLEVSPMMYRSHLVEYFQQRQILVCAYKPLNRATVLDNPLLNSLATAYGATPAQIMLRWALQKGLIVAAKTSTLARMQENRSVLHFHINDQDMVQLDELTTPEALSKPRVIP